MMNSFAFGFGSWRYLLAMLVLVSHLYEDMIHGPAAYAVYGFFVLSGFLMTLILNDKYGFGPKGVGKYLNNRLLRIYPQYWLACLIGFFVYKWALDSGVNTVLLNGAAKLPANSESYWYNVLLNPIASPDGRLVAVSHALAVEIGAYILIILFGRTLSASLTMAACSLIVILSLGLETESFVVRYCGFMTSMLPFAVGALLYHLKDKLDRVCAPKLSLIVWVLNGLVWLEKDQYPWREGLYVSIILSAWVTISLYKVKSSGLDKFLGELSYPVYLLHTTCGIVVLCLLPELQMRSLTFMIVSCILTMLISALTVKYFDPLIMRFKRPAKLKHNKDKDAESDPPNVSADPVITN